jgi:predicted lipoprotein with Yx(FWY)xxD motif
MTGLKTVVFGATVLVALVFASVSAGLAMGGSASRPATVASGSSGLGRIIVDGHGRTLYLFEKDRRGASACSGVCAAYWPPLLTQGAPAATKGAKRSLLGTIRRADGTRQVTYAGHPLYFYAGDTKRGQTNGEGLDDFGAGWYALMPSGKKIDRD